MVAGSHERIVPQIAADICLDHFAADSITGNKVFILTACHDVSWGNVPEIKWFLRVGPKQKMKIRTELRIPREKTAGKMCPLYWKKVQLFYEATGTKDPRLTCHHFK